MTASDFAFVLSIAGNAWLFGAVILQHREIEKLASQKRVVEQILHRTQQREAARIFPGKGY